MQKRVNKQMLLHIVVYLVNLVRVSESSVCMIPLMKPQILLSALQQKQSKCYLYILIWDRQKVLMSITILCCFDQQGKKIIEKFQEKNLKIQTIVQIIKD